MIEGRWPLEGKTIVLSPHADDAVWSLGGGLAQNASQVEVITIFDADPQSLLDDNVGEPWRGVGGASRRRAEDQQAALRLGLPVRGLDEPDAAFRRGCDGQFECNSIDDLFVSSEHWAHLPPPAWTAKLLNHLGPCDLLVAPMGFGRHIDHVQTWRASCEMVGPHLMLYAEFPYWSGGDIGVVQQHLAHTGWMYAPVSIEVAWEPWAHAASAYRSQFMRMFGSHAAFMVALEHYARRSGHQATCWLWHKRAL